METEVVTEVVTVAEVRAAARAGATLSLSTTKGDDYRPKTPTTQTHVWTHKREVSDNTEDDFYKVTIPNWARSWKITAELSAE